MHCVVLRKKLKWTIRSPAPRWSGGTWGPPLWTVCSVSTYCTFNEPGSYLEFFRWLFASVSRQQRDPAWWDVVTDPSRPSDVVCFRIWLHERHVSVPLPPLKQLTWSLRTLSREQTHQEKTQTLIKASCWKKKEKKKKSELVLDINCIINEVNEPGYSWKDKMWLNQYSCILVYCLIKQCIGSAVAFCYILLLRYRRLWQPSPRPE